MPSESNSSLEPLRALLVEDDAMTQRAALALLKDRGAVVTVAENGRDAIEAWAISRFDVILMNTQIPGIDGFDATRIIRAREELNERVPIIALTTRALPTDRYRCAAAGMDECIAKPLNARTLMEAIERLVGRSRVAGDHRGLIAVSES
jgi:two-component system, sensor histidine kinase and response regulator